MHDDKLTGRDSYATALGDGARTFKLDQRAKRVFDIVAATMGLILFAPILLVTSIAIKLDSRGPIFIRETLYGCNNRAIQVLKFRLVTACAEAIRINPRATRVGRILRRAGIDELPQLFNVLRGEMSIVGPRPHAGRRDLFEHQSTLLLIGVKPGLTGWAQVIGREECETTEQRVNHDLHYVQNWSLFLDIKIVLMTLVSKKLYATTNFENQRQDNGVPIGRLESTAPNSVFACVCTVGTEITAESQAIS